MTKSNYTYKDTVDVQRLLLKKATALSEANKLGNEMYELKNQKLRFQQEIARAEKELLAITIKNNDINFIKEIKHETG